MNFNEKLINLRKSKGLSQEELGNELKVPDKQFQNGSHVNLIQIFNA